MSWVCLERKGVGSGVKIREQHTLWVVDEGAVDVELDLVFVFMAREGVPRGRRSHAIGARFCFGVVGRESQEYRPCIRVSKV